MRPELEKACRVSQHSAERDQGEGERKRCDLSILKLSKSAFLWGYSWGIIFHDISYESNEFGPGYLAGCFGMGEFARTRPDPDSTVDVRLSYFQTNQHLL